MSIVPAGTPTFLVADPDPRVGAAVVAHGGRRVGDRPRGELVAVFESAPDAVAAAWDVRAGGLRVAVHGGRAWVQHDGRYLGPAVRATGLLREIAGDGQALVSVVAAGPAPAGAALADRGVHRLRDLSPPLRVLELVGAGEVSGASPLRSLDAVPNNLPVHRTGFVGRSAEVAAVGALLMAEPLVTLTGVGGAGKSRLAAQVAAAGAESWPDGVWWVELEALTDAAAVADHLADVIGAPVEPAGGPLRSATAQLRDRRALVCLDNCERVLDGVAEVALALLGSCPEVTVLATSREPIGIAGEVSWQVPALAREDALALFVERASMVRPWFTLDASSEAAVETMCARLDGIPLALELAAAWLRTLTPQQVEAGLDDRFALLVRGQRGAAPRQQTLAASIDWSHALLDESDRIVLRRLAVLAGGFDLEAARSVCSGGPVARGDVLDALGRLVDKSLVVASDARYRLLETIRQFAADRLDETGETTAARDRQLDHFLALAEGSELLRRRDMDAWRACLELEHDNLRAALDWGLATPDPARGRRLAAALPWLWHLHRHGDEGLAYLQRAIERAPDDRSRLQAQLLTGVALVADTARPLDLEYDAAQRALEIATERDDDELRALCLVLTAVGQFYTDFHAGWRTAVEAGAAAKAAGDALVADAVGALQGIILTLRDRHEEAEPLLQAAVDGLLRHHRGIAATTLCFQAGGLVRRGEVAEARQLAERAVDVAEPLGDYLRVGGTRSMLALVLCVGGDVEAGLRVMEPVLRLVEGAESDVFVPGLATTMGTLHLWRDEAARAAEWFERDAGSTDRGAETYLAAQALPGLAAALAAADRRDEAERVVERALAVARRLGMPSVLADALEQQARLAAASDAGRAVDLHHEALAVRVEHGLRAPAADSLDALVALAEPAPEAVRVLAACDEARRTMGCPRPPAARCAHEATMARLRAAFGEVAFAEAWAAGAGLTLDEAITYVRRGRGARRRPALGWDSLTPAELDVVRLVVAGLDNPGIGGRLFMSRGTVKTHLSHVFAKLGVANRTELATLAAGRAEVVVPGNRRR